MKTYLFACRFLMANGASYLVKNVTVSATDQGDAWMQLPEALGSTTSLATPITALMSVVISELD